MMCLHRKRRLKRYWKSASCLELEEGVVACILAATDAVWF